MDSVQKFYIGSFLCWQDPHHGIVRHNVGPTRIIYFDFEIIICNEQYEEINEQTEKEIIKIRTQGCQGIRRKMCV
jgi:hypothetical protein